MNKSYLAWSKEYGYAVCLGLPFGFGLTIDFRYQVVRFGSYYVALLDFLDYDGRGDRDKADKTYTWDTLYAVEIYNSLGEQFENLMYWWRNGRKRNFSYECWKCDKWHKIGKISPIEAERMRKDLNTRVALTSYVNKKKKGK